MSYPPALSLISSSTSPSFGSMVPPAAIFRQFRQIGPILAAAAIENLNGWLSRPKKCIEGVGLSDCDGRTDRRRVGIEAGACKRLGQPSVVRQPPASPLAVDVGLYPHAKN